MIWTLLKKYRFLSKIKLRPPIEIEWSLNFWASTAFSGTWSSEECEGSAMVGFRC